MVSFELYAVGRAAPLDVAALVRNPRRLPEWTDVEEILAVEPEPVAEGGTVTVRIGGQVRTWQVVTAQPGLVEAETETAAGVLGVGARVLVDPLGSRVVLAVALRPRRRRDELAFRLRIAPGLRRRLDRWARNAVVLPLRAEVSSGPVAARPVPAQPVPAAAPKPRGEPATEGRIAARSQGRLVCFTCRAASPTGSFPVTSLHRTAQDADPDGANVVAALICPACGTPGTAVFSTGPTASHLDGEALALLRLPTDPAPPHDPPE